MFPIVFAAITGRSMKMIARFLAERGSRISVREPLQDERAKKLSYSHSHPKLLTRHLDVGAPHGKSVCLGYFRKSTADATTHCCWREPPLPLGSFTIGWSSFASTNDKRHERFLHIWKTSIYDYGASSDYVGSIFDLY